MSPWADTLISPRLAVKRLARRAGLRRRPLAVARLWCERTAIVAIPAPRLALRARILCCHSVGTPAWGVNDVCPARFRRQAENLLLDGYRFVPAEQIAATGGEPGEIALTFDDNLASVACNAAPMLADLGIPWTLFVVSDWADGRHSFADGVFLGWRDIERLAAGGATIGSHSLSHADFGRLGPEDALRELAQSRAAIESHLGIRPASFAIPLGQARNWTSDAQAAAKLAGYATIYAQAEAKRPAGAVARTFITKFDNDRIFAAALHGAFDRWEEWL